MYCAYHNGQPVQGICSTCGRPVCAGCAVDLNGQVHCKPCLADRVRRPAREVVGLLRFLLSVIPGVGHLYMGLFQRGLQFMVGGAGLAIVVGMLFPPLLGLLIPSLVFFSIFDAREAHLRLNQGLEVEDKGIVDMKNLHLEWNSRYVAYALIGIGALALYNTLLGDVLQLFMQEYSSRYYRAVDALRGITVGALALGAGVWMLRRNFGKSSQQ